MNQRFPILIILTLITAIFGSAKLHAQTARSFDELHLFAKAGDILHIVDRQGQTSRGRVMELTDASLRMQIEGRTREFGQRDITAIRKRIRDSLKNGSLIGLAAGAGMAGAMAARECDRHWCSKEEVMGVVGVYAGLGTAIGAIVDKVLRTDMVVFQETEGGTPNFGAPGRLKNLRERIRFGDRIRVTDVNGHTFRGRAAGLSSSSIQVKTAGETREWNESQIREIRHHRDDSWWNGILVGIVVGGIGGAVMGASGCDNDPECAAYATPILFGAGAGVGAAAGAVIDLAVTKEDTIYPLPAGSQSRIGFSPILTKYRKGISIQLSF